VLVTHDLTPSLTVQLDRTAIAPSPPTPGRAPRTSPSSRARSAARRGGAARRRPAARRRRARAARRLGRPHRRRPTEDEVALSPAAPSVARREAGAPLVDARSRRATRRELRANVDLPEEAESAATSGAEGVG
jgi:phosphotransferase system enzyme I (PtsI)